MGAEEPAIMTQESWGEGHRCFEIHAGKWLFAFAEVGKEMHVCLRLKEWAGSGGTGTGRILPQAEAAWEKALGGGTELKCQAPGQRKGSALLALLLVYLW